VYLKSLEVQGFKSFPDKTLIRFGDDITAIVGPNGSGKSNISDAILWVMGEQSTKTLRGAKMEDVIFGGTQKRSAVGFAEATLTLDNSDRALMYDSIPVIYALHPELFTTINCSVEVECGSELCDGMTVCEPENERGHYWSKAPKIHKVVLDLDRDAYIEAVNRILSESEY